MIDMAPRFLLTIEASGLTHVIHEISYLERRAAVQDPPGSFAGGVLPPVRD